MIISLMPFFAAGCQTFVSPLSQWRAAYDGNLVRGPSKDEMADITDPASSNNLFDRWITPRRSAAASAPNSGVDADPGLGWLETHDQTSPRPCR